MFDLAISSYTPTLGALLSLSSPSSAAVTGILAVGQEATAGCAPLPGTREELASIQRHARTLAHKQLHGNQVTVAAVLDAMEAHDSVHLACHASQNVENPTESGFHLHDGTLSLAEIAKRSFKNKRLAFLSACQTAAGDKKLPDEVVHLAAGMMVAGYPSVIATMWSIKDNDAPLIADRVYARLLQGGGLATTGGPARALHAAVGALRAKVGEKAFARWLPYIHMGR